jgi:SprT-like family
VIQLSQSYVNRANSHAIRETILHEIAHVLVPDDRRHGSRWQATARRIGADPNWLNEDNSWGYARRPEPGKRARAKARRKATTK